MGASAQAKRPMQVSQTPRALKPFFTFIPVDGWLVVTAQVYYATSGDGIQRAVKAGTLKHCHGKVREDIH